MKVVYNSEAGVTLPDGKVRAFAADVVKNRVDVVVSSEVLVDAIRLDLLKAGVPPTEVQFMFDDEELHVDDVYRFTDYPSGFCDLSMQLLRDLRVARGGDRS